MPQGKEFAASPDWRPACVADEVQRLLDAAPPRAPVWTSTPEAARAEQALLAQRRTPGPDMHVVKDIAIDRGEGTPPLSLRLYVPRPDPAAAIVYFHGGGWVMGSVEDSDAHVRRIAAATGCVMLSVEYRLAPEHPFPAAVDDALAAWRWVRAHRRDWGGTELALGIAGDSAGGNIAAGAMIGLRDEGDGVPAFSILGYPVLSAAMDTPSYMSQQEGPVLSAADMRWFWNQYAPDTASRTDPRAAPLAAPSLAGLPPTMVLTAECDPLRDEGQAYADRLSHAGCETVYRCYAGMVHGFYKISGDLAGSRQALADIAAFVAHRAAMPV